MRVFAPGKLVVAGEYAVLDGGTAVVAAVDRGVACEVSEGDAIETPGDDRFARAALSAVEAPARRYVLSDARPVELPGKPGFGGSAAATVAACAAGLLAGGRTLEDLLEVALEVHGAVQGSGSGIDVRASVAGGLRRFPGGEEVALPPLSVVWSGQSARTGPRVERYLAWKERHALVRTSEAFVRALPTDPVAALDHLRELLVAVAREAGFDYLTAGHRRIAVLAREHGGAAKPSGAGGGDVAVAIVPDPEARVAFEQACAAEGLTPIAVELARLVAPEGQPASPSTT